MNWSTPNTYAVKHKNIDVRMASRSGGIFTALSDKVLNENGVVYGCVLTDDFHAIHARAEKAEGRNRMRGSKYIQSDMGRIFAVVRSDLEESREVLFSGTSCQIAGLKAFLAKDYPNLLCVDIVCHGVPSPLVWEKYLKWQELRNGTCIAVDFRNKKDFGWADHTESLIMRRQDRSTKRVNSKVFTNIFYEHAILRPSCYKCPYKSIVHLGDITIADYWGIDKATTGFNDNKGVSLVLINNELGQKMLEGTIDELEIRKTRIEDSLQEPLMHPFDAPHNRVQFWKNFCEKPFDCIARIYGHFGWQYQVKAIIKKIGKCLIK